MTRDKCGIPELGTQRSVPVAMAPHHYSKFHPGAHLEGRQQNANLFGHEASHHSLNVFSRRGEAVVTMGAPSDMPTFPCWVRATYSWGGETKKDLGFVEGDLIEALNAGDGAWWMGRLRRDPRAIGLFPSNFVKVLDESFKPAPNSRNSTPLTKLPKSQNNPVKNSVFRKPYQAYGETKRAGLENGKDREGTPESEKKSSRFRPYSSMKTAQAPTGTTKRDSSGRPTPTKEESRFRIPSPPPRGGSRSPLPPPSAPPSAPTPGFEQPAKAPSFRAASPRPGYQPRSRSPAPSRPHSPLPATYHDGSPYPQILPSSRQPSPNPYQQQQQQQQYRVPSPQSYFEQQHSRVPSPFQFEDETESSPPPPPPPAHRVAYQPSRPPTPPQFQHAPHNYGAHGTRTPVPPSPGGEGGHLTPSPLRDAMNDVMSSLQDMSVLQQSGQPLRHDVAADVWSPEAFELVRTQSQQRAQSSLGFARSNHYYGGDGTESQTPSLPSSRDGPPQLNDFVQRMERQLRHTQSNISYSSDNPPAPPLKGSQFSSTRPTTSSSQSSSESSRPYRMHSQQQHPHLRHQKSAYEALNRTYTTKTNATNSTENSSATQSSNSTQLTSRSLMSGYSAGGFSATSAGSLARRKFGLGSQRNRRPISMVDTKSNPDINSSARSMILSEASGSGPSYHESHASGKQGPPTPNADWSEDPMESAGVFGGLGTPKSKKSNFFKKMLDSAKTTARTGAASARSTIGSRPGSRSGAGSPTKSMLSEKGVTGIAGGLASRPGSAVGGAAKDMGLGGGIDWMQVRRDINRSNSLSRREREGKSRAVRDARYSCLEFD